VDTVPGCITTDPGYTVYVRDVPGYNKWKYKASTVDIGTTPGYSTTENRITPNSQLVATAQYI
jgi:hypothetical protein